MKNSIIFGAIYGFLAVSLGAFGAHALDDVLDAYGESIWHTAVQYQMFHAVGIIVTGILMHPKLFGEMKALKWASVCMNTGIIFFSGSLYVLALSGIRILGAITPIGGVLFLIGWLLLVMATLKSTK